MYSSLWTPRSLIIPMSCASWSWRRQHFIIKLDMSMATYTTPISWSGKTVKIHVGGFQLGRENWGGMLSYEREYRPSTGASSWSIRWRDHQSWPWYGDASENFCRAEGWRKSVGSHTFLVIFVCIQIVAFVIMHIISWWFSIFHSRFLIAHLANHSILPLCSLCSLNYSYVWQECIAKR